MNPFILKYKEKPNGQEAPIGLLEYSNKLNLTVVKKTGKPAIGLHLETETITKTAEVSDTDKDVFGKVAKYLDTKTMTFEPEEVSDSDNNRRAILSMLETQTVTENIETTDSDK